MIDELRILRETFIARAELHSVLGSTNDRAAQCSAAGVEQLPLLVVADRQTAGRGRCGSRWWTGPGALAMSLLVEAETVAAERGRSPLVALATAAAVIETAAPLLPEHTIGLNWPNDVVLKVSGTFSAVHSSGHPEKRFLTPFAKLGGILVEVLPDRRHVVGIGLNSNNTLSDAPPELQSTIATIRDLSGKRHDQTDLLVDLLRRLERVFGRLRASPADVAAGADELCLQRGRILSLQRGNGTTTGLCRGIAPDGALLLETPSGVESFHSGRVTSGESH